MAQEAFSDPEVSTDLNRYFVSIKVDREQRPDIDQYLMSFLMVSQGQGGWPLNAFLTPDLRPIYALTYAPVRSGFGAPGFLYILGKVKEFFDEHRDRIEPFNAQVLTFDSTPEDQLKGKLLRGFDAEYGGHGQSQKFPSFCTLLFILSYGHAIHEEALLDACKLTLDQMAMRGLHDHLQGGFFRYCVDREWTIPHFEKMLYDQALALWTYSLAFKVFQDPAYKKISEKVLRCLEETFRDGSLYVAAHDADTDHEEGATYLWEKGELRSLLTPEELERFCAVYQVTDEGNFEGKNHLLKKETASVDQIENKLLAERKKREQPHEDKKKITSWNCLAGIAFVHAYRFLGLEDCLEKADQIALTLLKQHFQKGCLAHSSNEGKVQKETFLQDVAALLLLLTYLREEKKDYSKEIDLLHEKMLEFKKGEEWIEGRQKDFKEIAAESMDQPMPSSVSIAELAALRVGILKGAGMLPRDFKEPLVNDFYNFAMLLRNGFFHVLTTPQPIPWPTLPALAFQVKGKEFKDCHEGVCRQ